MRVFSLALAGLLSGCAALGGGADYRYVHVDRNGASCEVVVGSARSLRGAGITITKDCELKAKAEQATANEIMAKAMADLIKRLPRAIAPAP